MSNKTEARARGRKIAASLIEFLGKEGYREPEIEKVRKELARKVAEVLKSGKS